MTAASNQQHGAANNYDKGTRGSADITTSARQFPTTKSYPSKLMQTISGNQANVASKSPMAEERRDSQAIDPLSHVRQQVFRYNSFDVLRNDAAYPQSNEYTEFITSDDALRRH